MKEKQTMNSLVFAPLILITVLLVISWSGSLIYRMYRQRALIGKLVIIRLLASIALSTLSFSHILLTTSAWWWCLVGIASTHYGGLLAYFVTDQFLNNKFYLPILRHKVFLTVTALVIIGLLLGYWSQDTFEEFLYLDPPHPTWTHFASGFFNYGIQLFLLSAILILYWRSLRHNQELTYIVRRLIFIGSTLAGICGLLVVELNILLSLFSYTVYRHQMNQLAMFLQLLTIWPLILGFLLPRTLLLWLVRPLERSIAKRQLRQQATLSYLHRKMIQIVPTIHIEGSTLHDMRYIVEISDARNIIWSRVPYIRLITPQVEAIYLLILLQKNTVIDKPGEYQQIVPDRNIVRYNLAVAKYMRRYELQIFAESTIALIEEKLLPHDLD